MKLLYLIVFIVYLSCQPISGASHVQPNVGTGSENDSGRSRFNDADSGAPQNCYQSTRSDRLRTYYEDNVTPPQTQELSQDYKPWELENFDGKVSEWFQSDQQNRGEDQRFFRYVFIPDDILEDPASANFMRVGLFKALNSTAFYGKDVYVGEDVSEGHGALFAIDTRELWGQTNPEDGISIWNCIASPLTADRQNQLSQGVISVGEMRTENFAVDRPVHAARFVYNLLHPNVYNEVVDTPSNQSGLLRMLGIESVGYDDVLAWTAQKDAIVNGPRVSKMVRTRDGRNYWATQDYFSNYEGMDIPYSQGNPIPVMRSQDGWIDLPGVTESGFDFQTTEFRASEAWVELKNGFVAYYIWGNAHQERGRAEKSFVEDPQNDFNGYLVTGRSCITCHVKGVQRAPSEMARLIKNNQIASEYSERAEAFWTDSETIEKYYDETEDRFSDAMTKIVEAVSDASAQQNDDWKNSIGGEPIKFLIDYVEQGYLEESRESL